jgi:hypothetical protein
MPLPEFIFGHPFWQTAENVLSADQLLSLKVLNYKKEK